MLLDDATLLELAGALDAELDARLEDTTLELAALLDEARLLELTGALDEELGATDDELAALLEEASILLELTGALDATLELLALLDTMLDEAILLELAGTLDAELTTGLVDELATTLELVALLEDARLDETGFDEARLLELTGACELTAEELEGALDELMVTELAALLAGADELSTACDDDEDVDVGESFEPPLPPQAEIARLSTVIEPSWKSVFFIRFPLCC